MIMLTKLDDTKILLNLDTVKYLESVPDTLIFFVNGDSVMVKESLPEVQAAVQGFFANIRSRQKPSESFSSQIS